MKGAAERQLKQLTEHSNKVFKHVKTIKKERKDE